MKYRVEAERFAMLKERERQTYFPRICFSFSPLLQKINKRRTDSKMLIVQKTFFSFQPDHIYVVDFHIL